MFLLDTNVVSELRKAGPQNADGNLISWATKQPVSSLFISAITVLEIQLGILQKQRKDPKQAAVLTTWLEAHVLTTFADRILPVDTSVALQCAALHVPDPKSERDALIAATALIHGLTLVTRNIRDFEQTKLRLVNPWIAAQ